MELSTEDKEARNSIKADSHQHFNVFKLLENVKINFSILISVKHSFYI